MDRFEARLNLVPLAASASGLCFLRYLPWSGHLRVLECRTPQVGCLLTIAGEIMIWTVLATIAAVIAAVIPLMVWSQNKREQSTGSRLLAQMMITPIGATQVEIAKFRCAVVPPNGDQSYLVNVLNSQEARKDLASRASRIPLDLPQQFLDKASVFSELTNSKIAFALSQVNRLKSMSLMVGDLSDSASEDEINELVLALLTQIKEAEDATGEAFQALLKAGKGSV